MQSHRIVVWCGGTLRRRFGTLFAPGFARKPLTESRLCQQAFDPYRRRRHFTKPHDDPGTALMQVYERLQRASCSSGGFQSRHQAPTKNQYRSTRAIDLHQQREPPREAFLQRTRQAEARRASSVTPNGVRDGGSDHDSKNDDHG
jgi:hypothetical protein